MLARRVYRLAGDADLRRHRRDVDDMAASAGDHRRQRQLHPERDAADVDVELAPRPGVVLVQEGPDVQDARVVDEDVEWTERSLDAREERREALPARDVERRAVAAELRGRARGKLA